MLGIGVEARVLRARPRTHSRDPVPVLLVELRGPATPAMITASRFTRLMAGYARLTILT